MNVALIAVSFLTIGQPADEQSALAQAREEARVFAKAFKEDDHGKLADLTFAPWVEKVGSRGRMILAWRKLTTAYRHQGLQIESYDIERARDLVKAGPDWLCVLPTKLKFQGLEGPVHQESHLLALSRDQGKSWRFLDAADTKSTQQLTTWLPKLPKKWTMPSAGALRHEKTSKDAVFTAKAGNFKTVPPKDWTEGQLTEKNAHLILENADDKIYLFVEQMDVSIDDVIQYVQFNQNTKKMRRLFAQKDLQVAGEKARYVRFEDSNDVQLLQYYVCAFNHHGMSYRVIGVRQGNDAKGFEAAYLSILQKFAFLADRPEWQKKNEGVPTRTVMLGGLAWFDIDRPRWTENTFDAPADYQVLDAVDFRSPTADAWLNVTLREAHGSLSAELQDAGAFYSQRLQNPKIDAVAFPNLKGKWTGLQIRGTDAGGVLPFGGGRSEDRAYLIAITMSDGIAAWIVLESTRGRQDETRLDFEILLESFVLQEQTKLLTPLAFPLRRFDAGRGADARVAGLIKKTTPLFPGSRTHEVIGFTADGKQALLNTGNGFFLEDLVTKKREVVPIKGRPLNIALSNDRKWLAWHSGDEITVQPMGFGFSRKVKAKPGMFSFSPNNRELLVVANRARGRFDYDDDYYPPGGDFRGAVLGMNFQVSKIERVPLDGSPPTPLFDWPLIRVAAFVMSPDGKQLAVVTNRDMPRTQQYGGLLYVCKPDGSDLRLVNKDPSDYRSLAWSADSKHVFAARRVIRGPIAGPGNGYFYDIERIAINDGAVVNLTQSSRIDRLWSGGADLIFEIRDGTLPMAQQGIFKIAADTLVKSAPPKAVARPFPEDLPARIATRLEKALGKTPLAEFVPTETSLAHLAKEFAAAVKEDTDVELDGTPESLDRLKILIDRLELRSDKHPINVLGVGACYGETLRMTAGAKWHLKPVPFGKWSVSKQPVGNSIATIVFPFSECVEWARFTGRMFSAIDVRINLRNQDCLLVYPPTDVDAVLSAHYPDFMQARKSLDDGKIDAALDAYRRELKNRPKNAALAREVVELCRAVDRMDLAKSFAKQAVESGVETPDLLLQFADELAATDAVKALPYYRKAAQLPGAIAPTFIKLGKAYLKSGDRPLAESCWRRAYLSATDMERNEIRRLMGLPELPRRDFLDPFAPPAFKDKYD